MAPSKSVCNRSYRYLQQIQMTGNEKSVDCRVAPVSEQLESRNTGAVKLSVYAGYFKSMGSIFVVIAALFMLAIEQFVVSMLDYYVSRWYAHIPCGNFYGIHQNINKLSSIYQGHMGERFKESRCDVGYGAQR